MGSQKSKQVSDSSQRGSDGRVVTKEEVLRRKASFDRFGDDLSELILNYLSVEDKFRLQCLSKRIRSVVFTKQYVLRISPKDKTWLYNCKFKCLQRSNDYEIQYDMTFNEQQVLKILSIKKSSDKPMDSTNNDLKNCLRKLENISDIFIDYRIDSTLLKTIADYCQHLRGLSIWFSESLSDKSIEYFGKKCGQRLKYLSIHLWFSVCMSYMSIKMTEKTEKIRYLLSFCTQLVALDVHELEISFLVNGNNEKLLPNLKHLMFRRFRLQHLLLLQDSYGHQLISLRINQLQGTSGISQVVSGINSFRVLKTLEINLHGVENRITVEDMNQIQRRFNEMAANCQQLRRLSIIFPFAKSNPNYLPLFSSFTQLTELGINFFDYLNDIKVQSFAELRQLSQLKRLNVTLVLTDNAFQNIDKYLPNLEYTKIWSIGLSGKSLEHISRLTKLKSLSIHSGSQSYGQSTPFNDAGVKHLIDNCPNITSLELSTDGSLNISGKTIELFKSTAKQMPKNRYHLELRGRGMSRELLKKFLMEIPDNLTITLKP